MSLYERCGCARRGPQARPPCKKPGPFGADNGAESRPDRASFRAAPPAVRDTLPLERFAVAVRRRGTPVEFSESAGGFLCNHVFFRARHVLELNNCQIPCGFLHVPATRPGQLEPWLGAVSECLRVLVESLE